MGYLARVALILGVLAFATTRADGGDPELSDGARCRYSGAAASTVDLYCERFPLDECISSHAVCEVREESTPTVQCGGSLGCEQFPPGERSCLIYKGCKHVPYTGEKYYRPPSEFRAGTSDQPVAPPDDQTSPSTGGVDRSGESAGPAGPTNSGTGNSQDTTNSGTGNSQDTTNSGTGNSQDTTNSGTGNWQDTTNSGTGNSQDTTNSGGLTPQPGPDVAIGRDGVGVLGNEPYLFANKEGEDPGSNGPIEPTPVKPFLRPEWVANVPIDYQSNSASDPSLAGPQIEELVTSEIWEKMYPTSDRACDAGGNRFYTYASFIAAAKLLPSFGRIGTPQHRWYDIATFNAHTSHETGMDPPTGGLCHILETQCRGRALQEAGKSHCDTVYCNAEWSRPCNYYFGRGSFQLTWYSNYMAFQKFFYDATGQWLNLADYPDSIAASGIRSFASAFWFYGAKWGVTMHKIITGQSGAAIFGRTTQHINGAYECRRVGDAADKIYAKPHRRAKFLVAYLELLKPQFEKMFPGEVFTVPASTHADHFC